MVMEMKIIIKVSDRTLPYSRKVEVMKAIGEVLEHNGIESIRFKEW